MGQLTDEDLEFIKKHITPPYNNSKNYGQAVRQRLTGHSSLLSAVIGQVTSTLKHLNEQPHSKRFVYRIDSENQFKSPDRIIQKIRTNPNEYNWDNFTTTMTDLVRFRIVCNFLGDARRAVVAIEQCPKILEIFKINLKNSVDESLHARNSGDRSFKMVLTQQNEPHLSVEIQVMTMLQEAWDKKDHPMVYEKRRIGESVTFNLKALMLMASELLYVADTYFEAFRQAEEDQP